MLSSLICSKFIISNSFYLAYGFDGSSVREFCRRCRRDSQLSANEFKCKRTVEGLDFGSLRSPAGAGSRSTSCLRWRLWPPESGASAAPPGGGHSSEPAYVYAHIHIVCSLKSLALLARISCICLSGGGGGGNSDPQDAAKPHGSES